MGKALIIKNVDFSENAVTQITFDVIHAEGIAVLPSTLTLDAIGATSNLTYIVMPSDAADPIRFRSSDANVATVTDEGVITVTGCGSCTITATAGTAYATCALTVIVPLTTGFTKAVCTHITASLSSNDLTTVNTYLDNQAYYKGRLAIFDTDNTKQRMPLPYNYVNLSVTPYTYKSDSDIMQAQPANHGIFWPVPIVLPPNCTKVRFKQLNSNYGVYPLFYQKDVGSLYELTPKRSAADPISDFQWVYESETTVNVPDGYDSFCATWSKDANSGASDFTDMSDSDIAKFTVEFM